MGNQKYCYPLTVTDHASRYLLLCGALESTRETLAITAFERLFKERGLPNSIRSDNGIPFASSNSLFNLAAFRCGGFVWVSASKGSGLVIPRRMDDTNGCI